MDAKTVDSMLRQSRAALILAACLLLVPGVAFSDSSSNPPRADYVQGPDGSSLELGKSILSPRPRDQMGTRRRTVYGYCLTR